MILEAKRLPVQLRTGHGGRFARGWLRDGGQLSDGPPLRGGQEE
jgi:hypothetical protein